MHEFSSHPQLIERDRWREVGSPAGPVRSLIPPATFRTTGSRMDLVPALGERTERILSELGMA